MWRTRFGYVKGRDIYDVRRNFGDQSLIPQALPYRGQSTGPVVMNINFGTEVWDCCLDSMGTIPDRFSAQHADLAG